MVGIAFALIGIFGMCLLLILIGIGIIDQLKRIANVLEQDQEYWRGKL